MKPRSIITIAVFLYILGYSHTLKAQHVETEDTQLSSTIEQVDATEDISYQEADKALNKVYKQILKKYEKAPIFLKKLKAAQRLWIQFRDAEVEMRFPMENKQVAYGTIYFDCKEQILKDMTIARTQTLKAWLGDIDEYDSCNGSKGVFVEGDYK